MKIELTKDEAAGLMGSMFAISDAQLKAKQFVDQQNAFIGRHKTKQEEIVKKIRKRVKGCPKTPLWSPMMSAPLWDTSMIDPVEFTGAVVIPDDKEEEAKEV